MDKRVGAMLAWLTMAAFCGLIGFAIVYYYATYERPTEHFAIVIDAGSTQTRSNLYRISVHLPELIEWTQRVTDEYATDHDRTYNSYTALQESDRFRFPLGDLIQVRQVSSCVNGGPLASISNPLEAQDLIKRCLIKFTRHIKLLDFVEMNNIEPNHFAGLYSQSTNTAALDENTIDANEVSRQLELTNHRVNSITHLHLGATAGMRALEQVNQTRAQEKLNWIDEAIGRSNELLASGDPYVNKGFVGIIQGSDEASFGWLSVNFVCDTLAVHAPPSVGPSIASKYNTKNDTIYQLSAAATEEAEATTTATMNDHFKDDDKLKLNTYTGGANGGGQQNSVGTLELGGASAQMALRVANNHVGSWQIRNLSLEEQSIILFNGQYRLGTRSDLCLGMSQAVFRLNYVLLHTLLAKIVTNNLTDSSQIMSEMEFINPCLQNGARLELTGKSLANQWRGACLAPNSKLEPSLTTIDNEFRAKLLQPNGKIVLLGSGNVEQCDILLNNLVDPDGCKRFFSLCPANKNQQLAPSNMPFVTISGYNHALNVLNLTPTANRQQWTQLDETIDNKLGGNSIDYGEFIRKTSEFCSTSSNQLLSKYPKVNKAYQNIICLQLIYIKKLLTEFYRFEPLTSWSQIKFLIFTPKSVPNQFAVVQQVAAAAANKQNKLDVRRDIGWTLGLILNATSYQMGSNDPNQIYFHHGASIMFIIRATIMLMLACCFIAIGLLVIGIVEVRHAQDRADAYIDHSSCSSSSYDVSNLGLSIVARDANGSKKSVQRYVLTP